MILTVLILALAAWISFVKSSIQAAYFLGALFCLTGRYELSLATVFLLLVSILIPKPNPRHQKRRFQITKAFYLALIGYSAWVLSHLVNKPNMVTLTTPNLEWPIFLMAPGAFFVFVIFLLFTRHHVH